MSDLSKGVYLGEQHDLMNQDPQSQAPRRRHFYICAVILGSAAFLLSVSLQVFGAYCFLTAGKENWCFMAFVPGVGIDGLLFARFDANNFPIALTTAQNIVE